MIITKRLWLRLFFGLEVICFLGFYFFGAQGIVNLLHRKKYNQQLVQEKIRLQESIKELESSINLWQTDSFLKEKMAREQLYMARPEELVYVIQ
ncbi:septum formation initiator family protein [bacterium]|nr:septum formation initiator family protein [bacterium]